MTAENVFLAALLGAVMLLMAFLGSMLTPVALDVYRVLGLV